MTLKRNLLMMVASLCILPASAQLSTNKDKFLGNITTGGNVDAGGSIPAYYKLWNQITCENESKWASVQGNRSSFNWSGADNAFNYAKNHNFTYKFHALVWGSQYPTWIESLSYGERYNAIVTWYDAVKSKYKTLPMIDVVNEAIDGHQKGTHFMKEALGGGGKTGYDWLVRAFDMAYERWPDAILIYNDFNTFQWNTDQYIDLVRTLRDAGAPIDAYGCQSHDMLTQQGTRYTGFASAMDKIQNALLMPMFSTEYDVGTDNDNIQLECYKNQIPYMWEKDYCAGITLWGYVYGKTWTTNGNSGIYKNGNERPAMTWLKEYMASDKAKNAKSPFPGMKKEASIYIRPAALKVAKGDVLPIKVHANMATKTIEKIDFYVDNTKVQTMTEAPYVVEYTVPTTSSTGWKTTKAVVTTTDGTSYERYGRFNVLGSTTKREPYNEKAPELPGTIKADEYDKGASGVAYSNVTRNNFTTIATKDGAWMEYTVDVPKEGFYTLAVEVASSKTGGIFHLSEYSLDKLTFFTDFIDVPNTGGSADFQTIRCPIREWLTAGRHVFCLNIDKGGFYLKSLTFNHTPTFNFPGIVEAEDFYRGGDGIDIVNITDGYAVTNTDVDEWMEYSVNVTQPGKYSFAATVSSAVENSKFVMTLIDSDGEEKALGTVNVPNTGGNDVYQEKSSIIRNPFKKAGLHTLRIAITGAGCNIDKIEFICTEPTGINDIETDEADSKSFNLYGMPVNAGYRGIVIKNGKKIVVK